MAYSTIVQAEAALVEAMEDAESDYPEVETDTVAYEMVKSIAWMSDVKVGRELCRRNLGYIPDELSGKLPGQITEQMEGW